MYESVLSYKRAEELFKGLFWDIDTRGGISSSRGKRGGFPLLAQG